MFKILTILFVLIIPAKISAQIFQKEGSKLNYRIIGFSFPQGQPRCKYKIEIASGIYSSEDSFKKNIVVSFLTDTNKIIAEVPSFGKEYTWQVKELEPPKTKSDLHHFSTLRNDYVDTAKFRLRILKPSTKYSESFVTADATGVIYDFSGNPIWFIPDTNGLGTNFGCIKFTSDGTVTFMSGKNAFEITYDGVVLWRTKNTGKVGGDTAGGEGYHHEFAKLLNGHYMVLGVQKLWCKAVSLNDSNFIMVSKEKTMPKGYRRGRFGTIIEYDEQGEVAWYWKSSEHLLGTDFDYFTGGIDTNLRFDPHDNSFYFSDSDNVIYLTFRNMNRIMKIDYPSGKVLRIYGDIFKPGVHRQGNGLFCNPHSINRSAEGYLYFFNNNSCRLVDSFPTVVLLNEPNSLDESFKKIWEYVCANDDNYQKEHHGAFKSGGNAIELADRSMFVCMGGEYSKLFIVTRSKKILWSALPERYIYPDHSWVPNQEYRGNVIRRQDLEKMIWKSQL